MDEIWLNEIAKGRALSNQNRRFEDPEPLAPLAKARAFATGEKQQSTAPTNLNVTIKEGTLAYKNNNPGNLRYAEQHGAVRGEQGFAKFKTPTDGFNALTRQVALDQERNHTLESFIHKFAPPMENDTEKYVKFMERKLGVLRNASLKSLSPDKIAEAMVFLESNTVIEK